MKAVEFWRDKCIKSFVYFTFGFPKYVKEIIKLYGTLAHTKDKINYR